MRTNRLGQHIGEPVPGWTPRAAPAPITLTGRTVRLEPAGAGHADALFAALGGEDADVLWTYRPDEPPTSRAEMTERLETDPVDSVRFAIVPHASGRADGLASLMRAAPDHGSVEVGAIIYGPGLRRTVAATEAMYLLARHVFDDLRCRRYEWKCDAANEPSRVAAARLGFIYEGRFRHAMVYKGRNRDTDCFSMLASEWTRLRSAYEAWLDPRNFDASDVQRVRLRDLIAAGAAGRETPTARTSPRTTR